jgi:hypothetical protein
LAFHSGRVAEHSPPSSGEVKERVELYLYSPNTPSGHGAQLGGHRDNFTFCLYCSLSSRSYSILRSDLFISNFCAARSFTQKSLTFARPR